MSAFSVPRVVNERLKHRYPIFGSIALMAKGREGKAVRRAIGQGELTVCFDAFVLRIRQATARRSDHPVKFLLRGGLGFEISNSYEVIKLLLAHAGLFRAGLAQNQ